MADSIDRVFQQALATIRALSNPKTMPIPLPRPPIEDRIHLYGLYKQATEGDVDLLILRPSGEREEDEAARKKWDAWYSQKGLRKTEAKRRYIPFLLETMRKYASATAESRELITELQFLWDQVEHIEDETVSPPSPGSIYISTQARTRVALFESGNKEKDVVTYESCGDDNNLNEDEDDDKRIWRRDVAIALDRLKNQIDSIKELISKNEVIEQKLFTAPQSPQVERDDGMTIGGRSGCIRSLFSRILTIFASRPSLLSVLRRVWIDIGLILGIIILLKWRRTIHTSSSSRNMTSSAKTP
ncbi:acyl CoA binding protein-domain-containing protein [Dipodascopsis uninucleata]